MKNPFKKKSAPSPSTPSRAVEQIVALMVDAPEDWSLDEHYAKHVGGAHVWIANGAWAAKVTIPQFGRVLDDAPSCRPTADHEAIWSAVETLRAAKISGAMTAYLASASVARERSQKDREEKARRLEFDAGTYADAARSATQRAADIRASLAF